ncbi:hypothetical protein ICW40_19550, partial [Actinotalea ferrariae]|uniref:hypothetical protein n=1 Tax=Actinotalea ferrariae TaxID=1386098 RepID=UPI001C8B474D
MTAVVDESATLQDADRTAARAARARAALARAEERTGTQGWVRPVRAHAERRPGPRTEPRTEPRSEARTEALVRSRSASTTLPVTALPPLADAVPEPPAAVPEPLAAVPDGDPHAPERMLAVRPDLAPLLPLGGLSRGSTVVVAGSTSLVLGLLAEASAAGSWVALVGLPGVGVLAAHELGIALDRVVLVPDPGADGPTVVAALLDGVDVVVVGPRTALADGDRRRLSARARERSSVLVPTTPWPGAHVVLTAAAEEWEGLGRGHGRLRSRRLVVDRQGRGSAARPVRAEVT